ncbi:MAG: hypothetical protein ACJAXX_002444 [Roseivirga sp.]|jgi:hypothetical protein
MMKTLSKALLACLMLTMVSVSAKAQEEISDQDLKDYAIVLLAQNSIMDKVSPMVNGLIEKQEGMTGNRFEELRKKTGEPAKEWETGFVSLVNKQIKKKQDAAKDVTNLLAKNSLGSAKYVQIRNAVKSDETMKGKIDALMAKLSTEKP